MKSLLFALVLMLPTLAVAQIPDPNAAALQNVATALANLQMASTADQAAQALVVSNSATVVADQANLVVSQSAQATTAAQVQTTYQALVAAVAQLSPTTQSMLRSALNAKITGDFHGDFHGGQGQGFHGDFHGGGFYPQPINPWNFVAPIVVNIATAPRAVTNPMTGVPQMMSPGQWVAVNAGTAAATYTWQPLPAWPLMAAAETKKTVLAKPVTVAARPGLFGGFFRRLFHRS
jgi:hypothetical protein